MEDDIFDFEFKRTDFKIKDNKPFLEHFNEILEEVLLEIKNEKRDLE